MNCSPVTNRGREQQDRALAEAVECKRLNMVQVLVEKGATIQGVPLEDVLLTLDRPSAERSMNPTAADAILRSTTVPIPCPAILSGSRFAIRFSLRSGRRICHGSAGLDTHRASLKTKAGVPCALPSPGQPLLAPERDQRGRPQVGTAVRSIASRGEQPPEPLLSRLCRQLVFVASI